MCVCVCPSIVSRAARQTHSLLGYPCSPSRSRAKTVPLPCPGGTTPRWGERDGEKEINRDGEMEGGRYGRVVVAKCMHVREADSGKR